VPGDTFESSKCLATHCGPRSEDETAILMDGDWVPAQYLRTPLPLYSVKQARNIIDHAEKNSPR
jgi:hypothetical protein